ncbi:MAG: DEAD/DEAH box helicase [Myxococcota bacterium]
MFSEDFGGVAIVDAIKSRDTVDFGMRVSTTVQKLRRNNTMSTLRPDPRIRTGVGVREHHTSARPFTPHLRLFAGEVLVDRGGPYTETYEEVIAPLATVTFDYEGTRVRAADQRTAFYRSNGGQLVSVSRALEEERRARAELERVGLVDTTCLDDFGQTGESADYVVDLQGDIDALASFGAEVVPKLEERGWMVTVDPDYPCQLAAVDTQWYGEVQDVDKEGDWFSLELGVVIDGERLNLLPTLLDLLEAGTSLDDLETLTTRRRFMALPLGGNHYLPVPKDRLRQILKTVVELYGRDSNEDAAVVLPETDALLLGFFDDLLPMSWSGKSKSLARGKAALRVPAPVAEPEGLHATLRSYQVEGVAWMQHLRESELGGVLADDMGLGKTMQTIAHLLLEKESGRMDRPSLVIAPTSLVGNWEREIRKFAPGLRVLVYHGSKRKRLLSEFCLADVVLTTYPLLVRDQEVFHERDFHLAILDEAQAIKNRSSQVSTAASKLHARHRLALTGTPVENSLLELWALFDFACPGYLGSAERFRELYRDPIEKDGSVGRLESLRDRVAPLILRRMKHTVAKELPPKTELVRPIELGGAQRDLYESIRLAAHERVRQAVKENGVAGSAIEILDALMKLRQVCCDPRLVKLTAARGVKESAKYEDFLSMVVPQLANGHRVLVFSQFTSMLELLSQGLREHTIRHVTLTGATKNRQALVESFQNGFAEVFLISLKAGGTGLTLTKADTVIHYDPWWNPAIQAQATDRAYRIGQTRPVFAYNLVVAGSVEERIMRLQQRKRHLADSILAPTGTALGSLSSSDVDDLFGPLD